MTKLLQNIYLLLVIIFFLLLQILKKLVLFLTEQFKVLFETIGEII